MPPSFPSNPHETPRSCGDKKQSDGFRDTSEADPIRRLLDQMTVIEEAATEISPQQVEFNDLLQNDELLALEAIYGDDVFSFDKKRGLRAFQIRVHVHVPDDFTVSAELHSPIENLKLNIKPTSGAFMYTFKVQFLPPLLLTCLLPLSYPTHHPPRFSVHANWLDCANTSSLCRMLGEIWTQQPGQEVLYQWVEWLQTSLLSYLGFNGGVRLVGVNDALTLTNQDTRAISVGAPLELIIPTIIAYNVEKCHEVFLNGLHQCVICYSEYAGTEFVKLPCQHFFCVKCMETYSTIHVKEGTVTKLLCPDTTCRGFIPPGVLRRLLGTESYEQWESLLLQKALDSMSDVVYCPRCGTACLDDEDDYAQCTKCFFSFCSLCRERRHVGLDCLTPDAKLVVLQERLKACRLKREQRRELEQINEILSVKEALRNAKQCPCCKMAIAKTWGCNKMLCRNCMHYFCYSCNKEINGYDHFKEGCILFPDAEILIWERRMNPLQAKDPPQVIEQGHAEMPAHGHSCPNCGQLNAKVGSNNCIFCRSCLSRYCALCQKVVSRSSHHYGPKGCKQHTADP